MNTPNNQNIINYSIDSRKEIQLLDFEKEVEKFQQSLNHLIKVNKAKPLTALQKKKLEQNRKQLQEKLKKIYSGLNNWQKTLVARHPNRPYALDYIHYLCSKFVELHGDRKFSDDPSFVCGIGQIDGVRIAIVANQKDRLDPMKRNFGMGNPEGYRKALRVFKLAEKFKLPIITMIDTPGAYPGMGGEERGQAEAIASNLKEMSAIAVPIICVVIGEGGSGGALGIGVGDRILMLEHSIYSVISPESCASIIWRDASQKELAAIALKNDAHTSLKFKLIDTIIPEPIGGAHRDPEKMAKTLKKTILKNIEELDKIKVTKLIAERRKKFIRMGEWKT